MQKLAVFFNFQNISRTTTIFTSAGNLYKVLFIYKKSDTFDDVFLIWRPSVVDFFLTKKELVSL